MVSCGCTCVNLDETGEFQPELQDKEQAAVRDNGFGEAMVAEDTVEEEEG